MRPTHSISLNRPTETKIPDEFTEPDCVCLTDDIQEAIQVKNQIFNQFVSNERN